VSLYAIDGTWNDERSGEVAAHTNVLDFAKAYAGIGIFYTRGVGTRLGWLGKFAGGVFGAGGRDRVGDAYWDICRTWHAGDPEIAIVGFSRGAALSLDLAHKLHREGIRHPDTHAVIQARPPIQFVGLFDVVGSFGVPGNAINLGHSLSLPPNVVHCCHAMALDERRRTFPVTRIARAHEVWFRGGHGDVGGGNQNPARNDITLRWMLLKAQACGLPIDAARVPDETAIDPNAPILAKATPVPDRRECRPGDRIHYTTEACTVDNLRAALPEVEVETVADEALPPL